MANRTQRAQLGVLGVDATKAPAQEKLYLENTLLRVAGALFRHNKRDPNSDATPIVVTGTSDEKTITIRPDPVIGQPGQLAHKLFFALIKKHSDHGLPIRSDVSFSKREIMRLVGRKSWGGKNSEELARALYEIHHTFIQAQFKGANGNWTEHSFNIFPEILIERRALASDPIEACTVTLAEPIVRSLQDDHFTCLNHDLMAKLSTIGQALYVRLFFHFANLHEGQGGRSLTFQKRYDAICREWLGGLRAHKHGSRISQQLSPHLAQLTEAGFLAGHHLAKARGGDGFVMSFWPGTLFYTDYDRFYRRRRAMPDQPEPVAAGSVGDALKVAYLFTEKLTGRPTRSIAYVTTKDRETASMLLSELSIDEIPAFIDYALREAERTNFDIRTLGGTRQYLAPFIATKARREAIQEHVAQVSTKRSEDGDWGQRLIRAQHLFETLPIDQQAGIRAEATAKAAKYAGSLRERMRDHHIARITAERYADRLKPDHNASSSDLAA